jgi:hypothetical protein
VQEWSVTAPRIAPLVTLWQLQITASSGSAAGPRATGAPAPAGSTSCSGATGGTVPVSGRSTPYDSTSPTSTPPSRVPSAPTTSLRYTPARESEYSTSSAPSAVPCASPKLATSTPSSFSLVEVSAPVKPLCPPLGAAMARAAVSAISLPGATRP